MWGSRFCTQNASSAGRNVGLRAGMDGDQSVKKRAVTRCQEVQFEFLFVVPAV